MKEMKLNKIRFPNENVRGYRLMGKLGPQVEFNISGSQIIIEQGYPSFFLLSISFSSSLWFIEARMLGQWEFTVQDTSMFHYIFHSYQLHSFIQHIDTSIMCAQKMEWHYSKGSIKRVAEGGALKWSNQLPLFYLLSFFQYDALLFCRLFSPLFSLLKIFKFRFLAF